MQKTFIVCKVKIIFVSNKNYLAMENKPKRKIKLLPQYFKMIGLGLMILAFVPAAIILLNHIQLQANEKEYLKSFTKGFFILGLLLIALSKDKNEDKSLMAIRVRQVITAVLSSVFYVIVDPFFSLLLFGSEDHISGVQVIFIMLTVYLMGYHFEKYNKSRKNKIQLDSTQSN